MVGIIKEKVDEEGTQLYMYRCKEDGEILWTRYENDVEIVGSSCKHYEWKPVGNGCYPFPMDKEICEGVEKIAKKRVKKISSGTTIWFLIPNQ